MDKSRFRIVACSCSSSFRAAWFCYQLNGHVMSFIFLITWTWALLHYWVLLYISKVCCISVQLQYQYGTCMQYEGHINTFHRIGYYTRCINIIIEWYRYKVLDWDGDPQTSWPHLLFSNSGFLLLEMHYQKGCFQGQWFVKAKFWCLCIWAIFWS